MSKPMSQGAILHDRATRGEVLTEPEQAALEAWYRQQDEAEVRQLHEGQLQTLEGIPGDVQGVLSRIKETASRIQVLDLQNASLRQEIASLQQRLSTKVA